MGTVCLYTDKTEVFLRILEYYSGILFLTTNRVGAFDDGFRSRIHLTLYYPNLTKAQSREIWKNNIQRMENLSRERKRSGRPGISIEGKEIRAWARERRSKGTMKWNGRQIRNSFQTALALAEFEATNGKSEDEDPESEVHIRKRHFEKISKAIETFDDYLKATHGQDEDKRAKAAGDRPEVWPPSKPLIRSRKNMSENSEEESSSEDEDDEDEGGEEGDTEEEEEEEEGETVGRARKQGASKKKKKTQSVDVAKGKKKSKSKM